jgi:hypothetical protein
MQEETERQEQIICYQDWLRAAKERHPSLMPIPEQSFTATAKKHESKIEAAI